MYAIRSYYEDHFTTTSGTNLVVANFFSTSNFEGEPNVDFTKYEKKSSSVFGSANLGFKDYLFLDLTLRGDWSSTLPKKNWNYWYPSANLGFIFSKAMDLESKFFSFGKLRAGYAQVGNDTDPYQLSTVRITSYNVCYTKLLRFQLCTNFNAICLFRFQVEGW